jgi:hypothetical protein
MSLIKSFPATPLRTCLGLTIGCILTICSFGTARATQVFYSVSGTFESGNPLVAEGSVSGTFSFDGDTDTIGSVDLATSPYAPDGDPGYTYTSTVNSEYSPEGGDFYVFLFFDGSVQFEFGFTAASSLSDAGGTFPITLGEEGGGGAFGREFGQDEGFPQSTNGILASQGSGSSTPEPGTLFLVLSAGSAIFALKRRRIARQGSRH